MAKYGFVLILPLIVITAAVFVSAVASVKVRQYDKNLVLTQLQAENNLENLSQTKIKIGQLQKDIGLAKQKGIDVSLLEAGFPDLNGLIKEKDFDGLNSTISSYSDQVNDLILAKEAEDLKKVTDLKNNTLVKATEYKGKGVNVDDFEKQITSEVSQLIDSKEYQKANALLNEIGKSLNQLYAKKQEADRQAAAAEAAKKAAAQTAPIKISSGTSYERKTINTSRGSFVVDLVTADLSSVRVITDTANSSDCFDACPTKPLASYVFENGGFAGINGTYFCPPDYSSCASKVGTFDLPVFNTRLGKLINDRTLFWNGRGMMAFNSGSATFFSDAKNFSGNFRATIANFPSLISGGANILNESSLDDKQRTAKITRGGIANKGNTLYLMIAKGATVGDLAAVMQTLGVDNGLNLDGGGSSALYYGGYKIGPGRSLPNAIILAQ